MQYVNSGIFWGAYGVMVLAILVFDIVVGSWLAAAIMLLLLGWAVYNIVKTHKDAKRVGVMTRAEHKLEQRYEAELHSVWESK